MPPDNRLVDNRAFNKHNLFQYCCNNPIYNSNSNGALLSEFFNN